MPASEIMHKYYYNQSMSNGKKIKSLAQAKAIASSYNDHPEKKAKGGKVGGRQKPGRYAQGEKKPNGGYSGNYGQPSSVPGPGGMRVNPAYIVGR